MPFFETDFAYAIVGLVGIGGAGWLFHAAWKKSKVWAALYGALLIVGGMLYTGRSDGIVLGVAAILGVANVLMIIRNPAHAAFPLALILLSNFGVIKLGGFPEYKKRFPAIFKYVGEPPKTIDPIPGGLKRKAAEKPPTF